MKRESGSLHKESPRGGNLGGVQDGCPEAQTTPKTAPGTNSIARLEKNVNNFWHER
jgi:hypothetical protein